MQNIEYGHYDIASNEQEVKDLITQAIVYKPDIISVFPSYLKLALSNMPENISLGCVIDYPLGLLDSKSRQSAAEFAVKNGADIVEIVAPTHLLCNRKYDRFRDDIKNMKKICETDNVKVRYILEYRTFTLDLIYKVCQILLEFEIDTIYPSSGYLLDDISDNILASALINKKVPEIKIFGTGNIWNDKQAVLLYKSVDLFGFKCHTINGLQRLHDNKKPAH